MPDEGCCSRFVVVHSVECRNRGGVEHRLDVEKYRHLLADPVVAGGTAELRRPQKLVEDNPRDGSYEDTYCTAIYHAVLAKKYGAAMYYPWLPVSHDIQ